MPRTTFTAFYPSRPFWAVSKVNFEVPQVEGWFHDQMVEEVYATSDDACALKVCRDGRILIRIPSLERDDAGSAPVPIEDTVKRWGEYLDFLNAFYLLLDSATLNVDHFAYFNIHEITHRDAFRVAYEDDKAVSENIATESIASAFQMGRYSGSYRPDLRIEDDLRIMMRHVISREAIAQAASLFQQVVASSVAVKALASFAKSLAEYKVGNYETSIVLAWFITESAISTLWATHLDAQNQDLPDGRRRINRERRDFLTGRDFTISIVLNMLELSGVLEHEVFEKIDAVRGFRNKIVHGHVFGPGADDATLALQTARAMIERLWNVRFTPNLAYSVIGL